MSNGTMVIVLALLGPVVVMLVEVTKFLAAKFDWKLSGAGKLKTMLVISVLVGIVAAMSSGELTVTDLIRDVMDLIASPPGFFEFFPALVGIFDGFATAIGIIVAVSQATYALMKKRLDDSNWLASLYGKYAGPRAG